MTMPIHGMGGGRRYGAARRRWTASQFALKPETPAEPEQPTLPELTFDSMADYLAQRVDDLHDRKQSYPS